MRELAKPGLFFVGSVLVCLAAWWCLPGGSVPPFDSDMQRLQAVLGEDVKGLCRPEVQRRYRRQDLDSDDASAIGFAEVSTLLALDCGRWKISASLNTYATRAGAWWHSRGLTQCGLNYCQRSWTEGRHLFIVTGPRPEAGIGGPWLGE